MRCILVHGAGGGGWEFDLWVPVFKAQCPSLLEVTAVTLQPKCEGGLEETTFDDYVHQVVAHARSGASEHESVVLVGASMGGMIVLAAAASLSLQKDAVSIAGIVLVCSCVPMQTMEQLQPLPTSSAPYPPRVQWAASPTSLEDTRACLPDASSEIVAYAASLWRDESGGVLNELAQGISLPWPFPLQCSSKRTCDPSYLCVIPMSDESVPPPHQQKLASMLGASVIELSGMLHISPLLGSKASDCAELVSKWISSLPST